MEIDDEEIIWREGEAVLFDDTRPHEVWNDTNEPRVVLLFDVLRPMNQRGRRLIALMRALLLRSHYVTDAQRNQERWERARGAELARALSDARQVAASIDCD